MALPVPLFIKAGLPLGTVLTLTIGSDLARNRGCVAVLQYCVRGDIIERKPGPCNPSSLMIHLLWGVTYKDAVDIRSPYCSVEYSIHGQREVGEERNPDATATCFGAVI
jgi:hypothetical protein